MKIEQKIETEKELEQWIKDNCYVLGKYGINGKTVYEGYGLDFNDGLYEWYYQGERGEKRALEFFATEKDAVEFAQEKIKADPYANSNFIGMIKDKTEIQSLKSELKRRNVDYWTDEIPYGGINDKRTRFFVRGCYIKMVTDLIKPK